MKTVTVFTPTYNRANLLVNAYESLKKQTCKDFEWLIVDDGSIDNTREVVDGFIKENIVDIKYIHQENRGQYFAHNTAAEYADSQFFTFLDSDDVYTSDAVERLIFYSNQISDKDDFAGVAGLKADFKGNIRGGDVAYDILDCSIIEYRYKYCYKGDKLECFKTPLIKETLFPVFKGKYVPNALVWNRIGCMLKMRYFNEILYYCEYAGDSMSLSIVKNRQSTPDAYLLYYSELSNYPIPVYYKIRSSINYWRFAFYSHGSFGDKLKQMGYWKSFLGFPLGCLCFLIDKWRE